MPVRSLRAEESPNRLLVDDLLAAWDDDTVSEPVVLLDKQGGEYTPIRLWVVWTRWEGIPVQERSRIIMEAYKTKADPPTDLLRVSVAWGLTPDEADQRQLPWR